MPTLQAMCPTMARREVHDLLRRYRRVWTRRQRHLLHILRWLQPGTVWAMDFADAPVPIDGTFGYLLAVRDLASGQQLLWLPVSDEKAVTAIAGLELLFRQHGPPLVLKSDNGSAFIAGEMETFLKRWRVWQLRSPPEYPEYNGACEAGNGSMKTRTHHQAARRGQAGEWTCDDAEAARLQANETARPWDLHGPTPNLVWRRRLLITADKRTAFNGTVARLEREQAQALEGEMPSRASLAARRREVIGQALVVHGLLEYRRGGRKSVTPPG